MKGPILYFQYIHTIYMTQILMGHGCFEAYLFEIQRNASPICAHCHTIADMAMHMLLFCPSWTAERTSFFKRLRLDVLAAPLSGRLYTPLCVGRPSRIFARPS